MCSSEFPYNTSCWPVRCSRCWVFSPTIWGTSDIGPIPDWQYVWRHSCPKRRWIPVINEETLKNLVKSAAIEINGTWHMNIPIRCCFVTILVRIVIILLFTFIAVVVGLSEINCIIPLEFYSRQRCQITLSNQVSSLHFIEWLRTEITWWSPPQVISIPAAHQHNEVHSCKPQYVKQKTPYASCFKCITWAAIIHLSGEV